MKNYGKKNIKNGAYGTSFTHNAPPATNFSSKSIVGVKSFVKKMPERKVRKRGF